MDVNVTEPFSHQMVVLYEVKGLLMLRRSCLRKKLQE